MNEPLYTPREAARILQVTTRTLYNWDKEGRIRCIKTNAGHRRYILPHVSNKRGRKICYCRVSTRGQKKDLERQIEFFKNEYPNHEIISDYGSGINFKRKGFTTLLDSAVKGNISEVVVTYKDRLCRFGFELLQRIIENHSNGKIVVLDRKETSPQEELVNDLLSIVTVFSSRLYGLRSHAIKRKIQKTIQEEKQN